jgi:hypothetical protein
MPPVPISYSQPATAEPHNFGPKCRLAPVDRPFLPSDEGTIPPGNPQFFYSSPIPIDDPLSTTTIVGAANTKSSHTRPQPFSQGDNNALEKAWLSLASRDYRRNHSQARRNRSPSPSLARANADRLNEIIHDLAVKHKEKHAREGPGHEVLPPVVDSLPDAATILPLCCPELTSDVGIQLRTSFCAVARKRQQTLDRESVAQEVMGEMEKLRTDATAYVTEQREASTIVPPNRVRAESLAKTATANSRPSSRRRHDDASNNHETRARSQSQLTARSSLNDGTSSIPIPGRPNVPDDGISGMPFVRVGTPETAPFSTSSSLPRSMMNVADIKSSGEKPIVHAKPTQPASGDMPATIPERGRRLERRDSIDVPVGLSQLHEVSLPALQMKPIYWSPVNDIATVLRATWFYK